MGNQLVIFNTLDKTFYPSTVIPQYCTYMESLNNSATQYIVCVQYSMQYVCSVYNQHIFVTCNVFPISVS